MATYTCILVVHTLSRVFVDGKRCWNHGQHSYALVRFLTYSFRNSFVKNHLNFFKSILGCARILSEIFMWHITKAEKIKRPLQTRAHELIHPRTRLNNVELAFFTQVSRSLSKTFEDPKLKSKIRKWNRVKKSYLIGVEPWIIFEWPTWEFRLWSNSVSKVELFMCRISCINYYNSFWLMSTVNHCSSENELSPTNKVWRLNQLSNLYHLGRPNRLSSVH